MAFWATVLGAVIGFVGAGWMWWWAVTERDPPRLSISLVFLGASIFGIAGHLWWADRTGSRTIFQYLFAGA